MDGYKTVVIAKTCMQIFAQTVTDQTYFIWIGCMINWCKDRQNYREWLPPCSDMQLRYARSESSVLPVKLLLSSASSVQDNGDTTERFLITDVKVESCVLCV